MKWDIIEGDTDGSRIDILEADTESEANEKALDKHRPGWRDQLAAGIQDLDPWSHIYARPHNAEREEQIKQMQVQRAHKKKNPPLAIQEYKDTKTLLKALWNEVQERRSTAGWPRTGPDFQTRLPEKVEVWEDVQNRRVGIKLVNHLYIDVWDKELSPTIYCIGIGDLKADPLKFFWNDRALRIEALNMLIESATTVEEPTPV